MITIVKGVDLFKQEGFKIIPTNLEGVMGAGLALAYKEKHPEGFTQYRHMCKIRQHSELSPLVIDDFIMMATKDKWKYDSKISFVYKSLMSLRHYLEENNITTPVWMPKIASGCGKLDFDKEILPLIKATFENSIVDMNVIV